MCESTSPRDSHTETEYGPYVQIKERSHRQETATQRHSTDKAITPVRCKVGKDIQSGTVDHQYDQNRKAVV